MQRDQVPYQYTLRRMRVTEPYSEPVLVPCLSRTSVCYYYLICSYSEKCPLHTATGQTAGHRGYARV